VEEFEPSALTGGAPWAKPLIELLVGVITQAVRDYQSQDEDGKDAREWIGDKDVSLGVRAPRHGPGHHTRRHSEVCEAE
jgi:hypothetical protein